MSAIYYVLSITYNDLCLRVTASLPLRMARKNAGGPINRKEQMNSRKRSRLRPFAAVLLLLAGLSVAVTAQTAAPAREHSGLDPILKYISTNWDTLTR